MELTLQELTDIIDKAKGKGYFANKVEASFLPLFRKLESIEKDKTPIGISDFLTIGKVKSDALAKKLEKAIDQLLESTGANSPARGGVRESGALNSIKKDFENSDVKIAKQLFSKEYENTKAREKGFTLEKDKIQEVKIIDISKSAIQELNDRLTLNGIDVQNENDKSKTGTRRDDADEVLTKQAKQKKGLFKTLSLLPKAIGLGILGIAALGAGSVALYQGLVTDGPFKGTLKIIGKKMGEFGINLINKYILEPLKKVSSPKFIQKMVEKSKAGVRWALEKTLKSGKYIGEAIGNFTKGLFQRIFHSRAVLNFAISNPRLTKFAKATGSLGKLFGKLGKKIFGGLLKLGAGMAGKGMKIAFKSIPFLGSIISLAFAFSRFKAGDVVGGLLELTSALLGLIPIPGLAMIPDIINMFRDLTTSKQERKIIPDWLKPIRDWFVELPMIKAISNLWRGLSLIFGGGDAKDFDKGIEYLKDTTGLIPGLGFLVDLYNNFSFAKIKQVASSAWNRIKGWGNAIGEWVGKLWDKFYNTIKGFFTKVSQSATWRKNMAKISIAYDKLKLSVLSALEWAANKLKNAAHYITFGAIGKADEDSMTRELRKKIANSQKELDRAINDEINAKNRKQKEEKARKLEYEKEQQRLKEEKARKEQQSALEKIVANTAATAAGVNNNIPERSIDRQVFTFIHGADGNASETFRDRMFKEIFLVNP